MRRAPIRNRRPPRVDSAPARRGRPMPGRIRLPRQEIRYETLTFRTTFAARHRRVLPMAEPAPRGSDLRRSGAVLAVRADRLGPVAAGRRARLAKSEEHTSEIQ